MNEFQWNPKFPYFDRLGERFLQNAQINEGK